MDYLNKWGKQAESVAGSFWGHSKSAFLPSDFLVFLSHTFDELDKTSQN